MMRPQDRLRVRQRLRPGPAWRGTVCALSGAVAVTAALGTAAAEPGPSRRKVDGLAYQILHRWEAATPLWLWPAGHRIEGCIKGGTATQRRLVVEAAQQWMAEANIVFDFGAGPTYRACPDLSPHPPLRISIARGEATSKLGTTAFDMLELEPTVKLSPVATLNGAPYGDADFRGIALHELGHFLGLRHEHQHPDSACYPNFAWEVLCNRVERLRKGNEFTIALFTAVNLVPRKAQPGAVTAAYDPLSIMHYRFSGSFLKSPTGACFGPTPTVLSSADKRRIARLYPRDRSAQEALILAQAPLFGGFIGALPDLSTASADRLAREVERLVSLGHPNLAFKVVPRAPESRAAAEGPQLGGGERVTLERLALGDSVEVARICRSAANPTRRPAP